MQLIIFLLIGLTCLIDIWAIVSLFKRKQKNKFFWFAIILLAPVMGAIGYFQIHRTSS